MTRTAGFDAAGLVDKLAAAPTLPELPALIDLSVAMPPNPPEEIQTQFVGRSYADAYSEAASFARIVDEWLTKHHGAGLNALSRVLDFGCGWGRITRMLLAHLQPTAIHAADVDPQMTALVNSTLPGVNALTVGTMPPTVLADGSIDAAVAFSVFSHLAPHAHEAWAREFGRIIAPGGMAFITLMDASLLSQVREARQLVAAGTAEPFHHGMAPLFDDIDAAEAAFNGGQVVYAPSGGGGVRTSDFYGWTAAPPPYVSRVWGSAGLDVVEWVPSGVIFGQAMVGLTRRGGAAPAFASPAVGKAVAGPAELPEPSEPPNPAKPPEPSDGAIIASRDNGLFTNTGYCHCCRSATTFVAHEEWLRDFYLCNRCGSIPRQRHIQAYLDTQMPGWERLTVHESSPSNDFIKRYVSDYTASQYFPDVPRGEYRRGVRSEDIEALTLADDSVDIFITQDVLEHVFHPDAAIREIHRVLKPGGVHVFTAPKHKLLETTVQRARMRSDGAVEHVLEENYHGNPIGDNRALVTYDYGVDFELLLSDWSGGIVQTIHTRDRFLGLDAEFNEVFVIAKPPPRDDAAVPRPSRGARRVDPSRGARRVAKWVRPIVPARARPALRKLLQRT